MSSLTNTITETCRNDHRQQRSNTTITAATATPTNTTAMTCPSFQSSPAATSSFRAESWRAPNRPKTTSRFRDRSVKVPVTERSPWPGRDGGVHLVGGQWIVSGSGVAGEERARASFQKRPHPHPWSKMGGDEKKINLKNHKNQKLLPNPAGRDREGLGTSLPLRRRSEGSVKKGPARTAHRAPGVP